MASFATQYDTPADIPQMVSERQLADNIGVDRQTLRRWRCAGAGPRHYRVGGVVRYSVGDIRQWLDGRAETGDAGGSR